ncbi:hypothetical protein ACG7TL_004054 [Trametes sanguinea]
MDSDHEAYILLLLSDSNLPTGSFVASAGLESYVTHGFFADLSSPSSSAPTAPPDKMDYTVNFLRDSLSSYAHSALPFVLDAHLIVEDALKEAHEGAEGALDSALRRLRELDELYESTTLNHVARRASKNQGVALLTLFSKGFSKPQLSRHVRRAEPVGAPEPDAIVSKLVDRLKLDVRSEETHGHLPICWGVLTAALRLSPGSEPVIVIVVESEMSRCKRLTAASLTSQRSSAAAQDEDKALLGPAMTWPLGEILAARHDLQHSRIFNS